MVVGSSPHFQYYQLALKQFPKDNSDKFSKEKAVANCLKNVDGIVRYFTWYQEGDENTNSSQVSLNLVLELCEMDLYTAIRRRSPPVLPSEIKEVISSTGDYEHPVQCVSLFLVCFYSRDDSDDVRCHGDIKPEDIIFVNDRFKQSDLGEARINVSTGSDRSFTRLEGTKTYGTKFNYFRFCSYHGLSGVADSNLQLRQRRIIQGAVPVRSRHREGMPKRTSGPLGASSLLCHDPNGIDGCVDSTTTWYKRAIRTFLPCPFVCGSRWILADHGD